jgi:hypothetical protein
MSPRQRNYHSLTEHDLDNDLELVGSVEIVPDSDGSVQIIACSRLDLNGDADPTEQQADDMVPANPLQIFDNNNDEEGVEFDLIEALSMACVNNFACYQKSILKTDAVKDNLNADAPMPSDRRHVTFSQHEIHEFGLTLGHHPGSIYGPPVMLDYESAESNRIVSVDEYENFQDRKHILTKEKGFSDAEVKQAWTEALIIRRQREETLNRGLLLMLYDDYSESFSRKYKRLSDAIGVS